MVEITEPEMIRQLHQAVMGLKDNPSDNGIIGDIREIKNHLATLNGQVARNTMFRKLGTWLTCALVISLLGLLVKLLL